MTRSVYLFALMVVTLTLGGCGDPNLATVQGVVTLDGKPVPDAFVTFTPNSDGATSYSRTGADGSYQMKFSDSQSGAFIGSNTVTIRTGDVKPDNTGSTKELIPVVYNDRTTLTADVKSGSNTFDWDLKSDAGKIVQPEAD